VVGWLYDLFTKRLPPKNAISHHARYEPFFKHKSFTSEELAGKDLLIVGDVHGCYDEYQLLLATIRKHTSKPLVIIFAGDMFRKGPRNREMMNYLKENTENVFCVRGNHEQSILRKIYSTEGDLLLSEEDTWLKSLTLAEKEFLCSLPYTISIPDLDIIVVHAGLVPGTPLYSQPCDHMLNMRSLIEKEDVFHGYVLHPSKSGKVGVPCASEWRGPSHVYFGHDARRRLQLYDFATGLDSGCVYGGLLSSVLISLDVSSTGRVVASSRKVVSVNSIKVHKNP